MIGVVLLHGIIQSPSFSTEPFNVHTHPYTHSFVTSDVVQDNLKKREAYIVMEFCHRGHLFDVLRLKADTRSSFQQNDALELFEQVVSRREMLSFYFTTSPDPTIEQARALAPTSACHEYHH